MTLFDKITFLKPVITKLFLLLTKRQKMLMALMLIMIVGFSVVETIGISAIMPFIAIVSDTSLVEGGIYKTIFNFLGFHTPEQFIIVFGIVIVIFYIFRGIYFVILTYSTQRYANSIYKFNSKKALKVNLSIPYKVYAQKNSGELMHAVLWETRDIGKVVFHLLRLCSEFFTIIMVYSLIVVLNWQVTLIITVILFFVIIVFLYYLTKINSKQGKIKLVSSRKMSSTLKESLGNLKFIKLKGNENEILKSYNNTMEKYTGAELITNVLGAVPKGILESLGFSFLIGVVVFIVWQFGDARMVIPIISMYALAFFRILPSINRLLFEINRIVYAEETLIKVYENVNQTTENEGKKPVSFEKTITLENICFQYVTGGAVIKDVSLKIYKGDKIAFTGESGSGKSTLVDIITGIHKPVEGVVLIDDVALTNDNIRSWRAKIGYIPQSPYLFDGTVAENVSFGSVYDEDKVKAALMKANIWDFLLQKDGLNTCVGDGGIQLSGGQQQRICIARAIYDDPEILVLDEATSALDNETEQKIMDEIYNISANKTLFIIAHRLTTIERCSKIVKIANGIVVV